MLIHRVPCSSLVALSNGTGFAQCVVTSLR
jgi:hypothetical protein